jgi:putative ABC transport system permease protein
VNDAFGLLASILSDGAIFGFAAVGIAITIGWGRFADLTPDAAFTGGAVGLWLAASHGVSALGSSAFGFVFGAIGGLLTATIVLCGVPPLLASLVVLGLAYSTNWMVLGSPLRTLSNDQTILAGYPPQTQLLIMLLVLIPSILLIRFFAMSALGLKLRAVCENPNSVPEATSRWQATLIWLALGNGMVGMSGAMFASKSFIVDINMGNGTLISGLSAFLFGWAVLRFRERVSIVLVAALMGAVLLRGLLSLALSAGAPAEFFRGITAAALLGCLLIASRTSRNVLSGLRL